MRPLIYMTFLQTSTGRGQMVLHVRTTGTPGEVVQRIREQVAAIDPSMPMFDVHTLDEEMGAALVQQRLIALLSSLFGGLALLLACVGLYGLLAFAMVQRIGEMGVRMALGARRVDVVWLVVREAWLLVAVGIGVGVPAALGAARVASSQIAGLLFGLAATDPLTIAAAACSLFVVATLAAYLPARRASRVDPMVALRAGVKSGPSWRCSLVTKPSQERKGGRRGALLSPSLGLSCSAPAESGRWNERTGTRSQARHDRPAFAISCPSAHSAALRAARAASYVDRRTERSSFLPSSCLVLQASRISCQACFA